MVTRAQRYRFTSEEYYKMAEAGIFNEDSPVELIDGEVVWMAAQGHRHAGFVERFDEAFRIGLGRRVSVWPQSTLHLGDRDDPEPDLVLLRRDDYTTHPPTVRDVLLIVEIAETTLAYDRRVKAPLYARHGIPEYWLVDVRPKSMTVTVYREPDPKGYQTAQVVRRGEPLSPLAFPGVALDTEELLA